MLNLSKLLAKCTNDSFKCVKVVQGVANTLNGHVLIRRRVDAPDGIYQISADGNLLPEPNPHLFTYPNIERLRPKWFDDLDTDGTLKKVPNCRLTNSDVSRIIEFINIEDSEKSKEVCLQADRITLGASPDIMTCQLNMPLPLVFSRDYMRIVLNEMLHYPMVVMVQDGIPETSDAPYPLFIGKNWSSCALIMPIFER